MSQLHLLCLISFRFILPTKVKPIYYKFMVLPISFHFYFFCPKYRNIIAFFFNIYRNRSHFQNIGLHGNIFHKIYEYFEFFFVKIQDIRINFIGFKFLVQFIGRSQPKELLSTKNTVIFVIKYLVKKCYRNLLYFWTNKLYKFHIS